MNNTMNGVNVAEKLGLGPEVRELKFGSSFNPSSRGQQQGSFHSVRYDFKPASVDASKMATLDVGPNGQVTISMPNVDGNGTTVFKGARKPYAKECVLIIDNDTGEVVLEKLTHNIQVKRTREEGGGKKSGSSMSMPVVPPPPAEPSKKNPLPASGSHKGDTKSLGREREDHKKQPTTTSQIQHPKRPHNASSLPPPSHHQQRHSPNNGPSPGQSTTSPPLASQNFSPQDVHRSSKHSQPQQPQQPVLSLTNFEDLLAMPPMNPPSAPITKSTFSENAGQKNAMGSIKPSNDVNGKSLAASALSESSSGSSSSSSSESDDDDSSDMEEVIDKVPIPPAPDSNKSPNLGNRSRTQIAVTAAPSMPTDLLCEDLRLSESGSDSE